MADERRADGERLGIARTLVGAALTFCAYPEAPAGEGVALWRLAATLFGLGEEYAKDVCREYGFDPERRVVPRLHLREGKP